VSRPNQKIYRHIEAWRNRRIEGEFPYLFPDGYSALMLVAP